MRLYSWRSIKTIKISTCITLSAIIMLSLMGASQDTQGLLKNIRRYGTEYTFRARIMEKTADNGGLVVQKTPANDAKEERIYVVITRDTKIGYQVYGSTPFWKDLSYKALKEGNHVLIYGLKLIEKDADQDIIYVEAKRIEPSE